MPQCGTRALTKEHPMYPYLRMAKELWVHRRAPKLDVTGTHVSYHRCWPQDIDPWMELNNGRTLTLYDLGRIPYAVRTGLKDVVQAQGWGITVAGNTTRYRRRVRMFDRIEMRTHCIGWDHRFFYIEQSMWKDGECTSHMLLRSAVTSTSGIVPPEKVMAAMGQPSQSPILPPWVAAWIAGDAERPWPPQR
jgi:acyl-CoA thioesterase FadM